MKKIALTLACICLSSTALAGSARFINTDGQSISITIETCLDKRTKSSGEYSVTCGKPTEFTLTAMKNAGSYRDLPVADDYEDDIAYYTTYLHVTSAKGLTTGASSKFGKFKGCAVTGSKDVVILDSYLTDHIICNDRSVDSNS